VLLTLATMGTDDSLSTKELRTSPDSGSFHAVAGLWQAQLTQREWDSLLTGLDFVPPASVRLLSAPQAERLVSASDLLGFPAGTLLGNADRVPSGSWIDTYIREAALLGLNGYGLPYRTLLPYWSALGCRYGTSNEDPQVMTVLLPEPITTPGVRTKLYKELFAGDFSNNIMQARVLLGRFRDDLPHLAPLDICSITIAAFRYAWTNITAYLDVLARLGELADSSQFSTSDLDLDAIEPLTLVMTGMVIDRSYMPDASGLVQALDLNVADLNSLPDKFIAPDWYDRLILFDPDNFLGADGSHGVINELFREETDTVVCAYLVGIRDMLGIRDPRDLLRLIKPREPDKLFDLALWTSKAERGLTPEQLPGIDDEAFRLLEQVAPGFVTKTRRLAAENGHADPFRGPSYP
jgi:hypothetical protein